MPDSEGMGPWSLAIPLAGLVVLGLFVAAIAAAFGALPTNTTPSAKIAGKERHVRVSNGCSSAVQVGWIALDPLVPLDSAFAQRFFEDATYVSGSEWPQVEEFSTYPNQTPVIPPDDFAVLSMDSSESERHRILIIRTFLPRKDRPAGEIAEGSLSAFDLGSGMPDELRLEDTEGSCGLQPPFDRRYRI